VVGAPFYPAMPVLQLIQHCDNKTSNLQNVLEDKTEKGLGLEAGGHQYTNPAFFGNVLVHCPLHDVGQIVLHGPRPPLSIAQLSKPDAKSR
jgi:hypothetical protein